MDRSLDAQADAFAQLLALSPDDIDGAFRSAAALAQGLFPHQIEGVAFLLGRKRAILADDMGLGKTRQAIVALRHVAPDGPYLVVCPASVKRNWAREIRIAAPDASHAHRRTRRGRSGAARVGDRQLRHPRRSTWTRSAACRGRGSSSTRRTTSRTTPAREAGSRGSSPTAQESQSATAPAVYLLTGTPLTNRPRDLFVLLQLVGHSLGRSFLSFAKRYCAAEKNEYGWQTRGASNIEELTVQLHGVMLRRSKDQVLALPPKLRTWLPVPVPKGTGVRDMRKVVDLLIGEAESRARVDDRRAPPARPAAPRGDEGAAEAGRGQGGRDDRLRHGRGRAGRESDRLLLLRGADGAARARLRRRRRSS